MNREQMVEKVWQSITAHSMDDWAAAEEAVDAILPLVTTVAELEALPSKAVLISAKSGGPAIAMNLVRLNDQGIPLAGWPYTVVSTPGVAE